MTLIVGVRCSDGVVIGSDSAMTFGSGQQLTIQQPFRAKIELIHDRLIVAGAGAIGAGQRFVGLATQAWLNAQIEHVNPVDVGRRLASMAVQDFHSTSAPQGSYGALVAYVHDGTAELIEFDAQYFQPEVKTNDNWYVSMGSGQPVADPLLGFARSALWGDEPPTSREGVFAVTLVLKLGCEMAPFGVSPPIQIATLSNVGSNDFVARRLLPDELLEHEDNVQTAIEHFGRYPHSLNAPEPTGEDPPRAPER